MITTTISKNITTEDKKTAEVTPQLSEILAKAFSAQFIQKKFEEKFKEAKTEIDDYVKNNTDGFFVTPGEATVCADGKFTFSERATIKVDTSALLKMINRKEITIAQVLECVSTFKNDELEKSISTKNFDKVHSKSVTSVMTMTANAEFKARMSADF